LKRVGLSEGESVFEQIWKQLHTIDPAQLRDAQQAFRVEFAGEGATDAGGMNDIVVVICGDDCVGPYRETLSHISTELQSDRVNLLIQCPNNRDGTGMNLDQWILNPSATDPASLSQYECLGKLMGIAMRTGSVMKCYYLLIIMFLGTPLNLDLSAFVWKQMIGQPLLPHDLFAIDVRVGELLKGL
jgi:hypothetical protein